MAFEVEDLNKTSSFIGKITRRLSEYKKSVYNDMNERAVIRTDRMNDLEVARQRFSKLFWAQYEHYQPLNQHLIARFPRMRAHQVAPVLEAEIYRIAKILTPLMREAEFDLGTADRRLRREMTIIWNDAQGIMQKKAFGSVRLPPAFVWRAGQIGYEEQEWKRYGRRGKGYYGLLTNEFYGHKRATLAV